MTVNCLFGKDKRLTELYYCDMLITEVGLGELTPSASESQNIKSEGYALTD